MKKSMPTVNTAWQCPACDRRTEDPEDQARHVAYELTRAQLALVELQQQQDELRDAIPDYRVTQARLMLSDEDLRRGKAAFDRYWRRGARGQAIPHEIWELKREYKRRWEARKAGRDPFYGALGAV